MEAELPKWIRLMRSTRDSGNLLRGALCLVTSSLGSFKNREVLCNRLGYAGKTQHLGNKKKESENKEGHTTDVYWAPIVCFILCHLMSLSFHKAQRFLGDTPILQTSYGKSYKLRNGRWIFQHNCCLIIERGDSDSASLVPESLLNAAWNKYEWGRPSWPHGPSPPHLSGSICQQGQLVQKLILTLIWTNRPVRSL